MYAIEMLNITKKFGDFYANKDITIQVKNNEIHALLGENGAGKSTLMSVLFGMYHQEAGVIKLNGTEVDIMNMAYKEGMVDLRRAGLLKAMQGLTSLEEVIAHTND